MSGAEKTGAELSSDERGQAEAPLPVTSFEEILARDGRLVYKTRGCSMLPMLHQNRDIVVIEPPNGRLKKYDVALYRRHGKYILHRIIRVNEKDYTARGDNNYFRERGVRDEDVVGVLVSFVRNGREHSVNDFGYRLYARLRCASYPFRSAFVHFKRLIKKLLALFGVKAGRNGRNASPPKEKRS